MKHTCFFSALFLGLFTIINTGCKKDYLDIKPKGKVIPSSYKDYRLILNNTNDLLPSYGQDELATDNVEFYEAQGLSYLSNISYKLHTWQNNVYTGSDDDGEWANLYKQIYLSNVVLDGMTNVKDGAERDRNQLIGEALVHRSFAYFSLVNIYGAQYDAVTSATELGVPLLLVPDINAKLERAPVKVVYDQIFSDLTKACGLLQAVSTSSYEPSLPAAYALLARASLQTGKFEDALKYASKALELRNKLVDYNDYTANPSSDFPENRNNPECIFIKTVSNSYTWFSASKDLQNVFKSGQTDLRYQILFNAAQDPFVGYPYYWGEFLSYDSRSVGITVPEMYIIKAECEARAGMATEAMKDINILRIKRILRTEYTPLTAVTPDEALLKVLDERRRELCFRGLRLFDLKRLNKEPRFAKTLTHTYKGQQFELKANDYRYQFPIASKYTGMNPELIQNQRK